VGSRAEDEEEEEDGGAGGAEARIAWPRTYSGGRYFTCRAEQVRERERERESEREREERCPDEDTDTHTKRTSLSPVPYLPHQAVPLREEQLLPRPHRLGHPKVVQHHGGHPGRDVAVVEQDVGGGDVEVGDARGVQRGDAVGELAEEAFGEGQRLWGGGQRPSAAAAAHEG